ncbi:lysophospholipid acyltransferase family protein [Methylococcus sp. BF19-07]|uniref:lysophospholipid acyltransferase family protein n=1 Tax=Methylococcus TaxID=413 RepID=UPI00351BBEFA
MSRLISLLKALYEYSVLYLGLLLYASMSLVWIGAAVLLYPLLPERLGRPVGRFGIMYGWRIFFAIMHAAGAFRFDTAELEALRKDIPLLLVANHPSLLDAVIVAARLPDLVCIMKANLNDNIFLGAGARLARYIRNDSGHGMIKAAVAELHKGGQLLIFPEGTRTAEPPVGRFKGGAALIARHAGVPVQTLIVETDSPFLSKRWPVYARPRLPIRFRIRLGLRFDPPDDPVAFTHALEAYYARELALFSPRPSKPVPKT